MLSIFIMYSKDRKEALDHTLSCLKDMDLYDQCQKTLVVDGKVDVIPEGWEAIQVPRVRDKFCWAKMWDAGVGTARNENVLYLDSDRMLPKGFLRMVVEQIKQDAFVFTSKHFMLLRALPVSICKRFLDEFSDGEVLDADEFLGAVKFETRFREPHHGSGKNVMSGSTAFTRKTYYRTGGVDHWYCGHGAFADTDFHLQAAQAGCEFIDLNVPELHYPHDKLDDTKRSIDQITLQRMGLDNFIYYCHKWGLPLALAESLAARCGIIRPGRYVDGKVQELKNSPRNLPKQ